MMEEQTTWKGHTFTLIVFTGIVVLCSIFFILGMLVGRAQGQKFASSGTSTKAEAKTAPKDAKPDFTFYDSLRKEDQSAALQPPPQPKAEPDPSPAAIDPPEKTAPAPEPAAAEPPPPPPPAPAVPANAVSYQIGALRKVADAQKLLDKAKKQGFRAIILAPADGDSNPFYRVQVGPFTDMVEAEEAKQKLKSDGYDPLLKR